MDVLCSPQFQRKHKCCRSIHFLSFHFNFNKFSWVPPHPLLVFLWKCDELKNPQDIVLKYDPGILLYNPRPCDVGMTLLQQRAADVWQISC